MKPMQHMQHTQHMQQDCAGLHLPPTGEDERGVGNIQSRWTASASMQGMQGMQEKMHATATVSPALGGGQGTGEKRARAPDRTHMTDMPHALQPPRPALEPPRPALPLEAGALAACAGDWGGGGGSVGARRHMAYSLPAAPLGAASPLHPLTPLGPVDSGVSSVGGVDSGGVEPPALPRHMPQHMPLHSQRQLENALLVSSPPSPPSLSPPPSLSLTPGAWLACCETRVG